MEYRPYQAGDETAIVASFNRVFTLNMPASYWRWKFASTGKPLSIVAIDHEGVVHAHIAGYSAAWYRGVRAENPAPLRVCHVGDVFCLPGKRNRHQKVMLKTLSTFHDYMQENTTTDLLYGFPSQRLQGLHGHLDVLRRADQPVRALRRAVSDTRQQHTVHAPTAALSASDLLASDFVPLRQNPQALAGLGGLWSRASARYLLSAKRDEAFYRWRFLDRPDVEDYYIVTLRAGQTQNPQACALNRAAVPPATQFSVQEPDLVAIARVWQNSLWLVDVVWDGRDGDCVLRLDCALDRLAEQLAVSTCAVWLQGDAALLQQLEAMHWQTMEHKVYIAAYPYQDRLSLDRIHKDLYLTCADADLL